MEHVTTTIRLGQLVIVVTAPFEVSNDIFVKKSESTPAEKAPIVESAPAKFLPTVERTCERCGKPFQSVHPNRKHCYSKECLKTATKEAAKLAQTPKDKVKGEKKCEKCGNTFKPNCNRQKLCDGCRVIRDRKEPKPKYNKMPVAELGDIDTKAPVVVEPVVSEFVMPDDWKRCVSCGRKFKSYEGDNDLCNPNCKPISHEQSIDMAQRIAENNPMQSDSFRYTRKGGSNGN